MRFDERLIPHPILFAVYPVLHLYASNFDQIPLRDLWGPLTSIAGVAFLANLGFGALFRNPRRGALALTLMVIGFFSYGAALAATRGVDIFGITMVGHTQLLVGYAVLLLLLVGSTFLLRSRAIGLLTRGLDLFASILVLFAGIQIAWFAVTSFSDVASRSPSSPPFGEPSGELRESEGLPDIYYIVLDGYGRDDTLRDDYGFDNSDFLGWLESRGFYIARDSSPNYISTIESLSSTLNLRYLEHEKGEARPGRLASIRSVLHHRIHDSEVRRAVEMRGYRFLSFASGVASTSIADADLYLSPSYGLTEFQVELVGRTLLSALLRVSKGLHARRIEYILETLPRLASKPGPKWVFAHLLVPHPPYVFDAAGNTIEDGSPFSFTAKSRLPQDVYIERYINQLRFVNLRLREVIDSILAESASPPIILLQGDHGPGFNCDGECHVRERVRILSAYHFPEGRNEGLYSTISPVNSFRYLFDRYFETDLGLLPDGYVLDGKPTVYPQ